MLDTEPKHSSDQKSALAKEHWHVYKDVEQQVLYIDEIKKDFDKKLQSHTTSILDSLKIDTDRLFEIEQSLKDLQPVKKQIPIL